MSELAPLQVNENDRFFRLCDQISGISQKLKRCNNPNRVKIYMLLLERINKKMREAAQGVIPGEVLYE